MSHNDKFVVSVKVGSNFLREKEGKVSIPFNTEYSIYLKNLNSKTAVVNISIDGKDVCDNQKIIVKGNSSSELKGFIKGNKVNNKFKFIQNTKDEIDKSGDSAEFGLIRVEFKFEKEKDEFVNKYYHIYEMPYYKPLIFPIPIMPQITWISNGMDNSYIYKASDSDGGSGKYSSMFKTESSSYINDGNKEITNYSIKSSNGEDFSTYQEKIIEKEGKTVKGSKTNQELESSYTDTLEENSHVIILKLVGYDKIKEITENFTKFLDESTKFGGVTPQTIEENSQLDNFCRNCGKKILISDNYCPRCGNKIK